MCCSYPERHHFMRGISCILLILLLFTASAYAWQHPQNVIKIGKIRDTIPVKGKDILPLTIKMPKKDSSREAASRNLLAFPFVVKSLETNWGFGGIAARFFK